MKVKDLITKLQTLPAEAKILVQGYEDGFDDVKEIRQITVVKKSNPHDWEGEYTDMGTKDRSPDNKDAVPAVVIWGNRR